MKCEENGFYKLKKETLDNKLCIVFWALFEIFN